MLLVFAVMGMGLCSSTHADEGAINLSSIGPIVFGPQGMLLISDPMEATIYAVETGDNEGDVSAVKFDVENVRAKVAALLGTENNEVSINESGG